MYTRINVSRSYLTGAEANSLLLPTPTLKVDRNLIGKVFLSLKAYFGQNIFIPRKTQYLPYWGMNYVMIGGHSTHTIPNPPSSFAR